MIDKPDPAKDTGRPDASGVKRPHATLDLKATEVKQPPQPSSAMSAASSSSAAATSGKPSPETKAPGAASPQESAAKASTTSSGVGSASGKPPPSGTAAKPSADGARSGGGIFSHLTAGVVGGALAYAGAALLGPGAGVSPPSAELEARLVTVETALRESADLSAKLAAAESRLANLDAIEQRVATLGDAQGKLEAETRQLAEQGGAANAERVQKLEDQLALIADGAGNANGGVPELAAITGKIAELDKTLNARIDGLGTNPSPDTDARLAAAVEASEAARQAAQRLERELAEVRSGQSGVTQSADTAKADIQRLQSTVSELRASLDSSLKDVARPGDVTAALGPVTGKLAELEQSLGSVVEREESRRENAERIVLALELANLKRAIDRGQSHAYAAELEAVEKSAGSDLDLSALARFKETGVATPAELKAEFRPVMNAVLDAEAEPASGSVIDRLMAGAKSVVRVRRVSHDPGDTSAEAVVARIETALDAGRLPDVIAEANKLSSQARAPMEDWLIKVTARDSVDRAIARVEERLKASLAGAPDPAPEAAAPSATAPDATPPAADPAAPESN
ncbi:MAG TPA: hypothetical protein PK857_02640 [Hyphomicrobium sp.]|nr:hypothetical protein [Hyphomicrobium sp.]